MDHKVLRLGLLIDSEKIPNWIYHSIKRVQDDGYADIGLLILKQGSLESGDGFLFNLYRRFDKRLFGTDNDADNKKDLRSIIRDIQTVNIEDIDNIKRADLDIIVDITEDPSSDLSIYAKYGIWFFDDVESIRIFSEILGSDPLLQSQFIMKDKDGEIQLDIASSQILHYSLIRDKNEHLWSLAALLPREIKKLSKLGSNQYFSQKEKTTLEDIQKEPFMIIALFKQSFRVARKIIEKKLFKEQWFLMYKDKEELRDIDPSEYKSIIPSVDQFWADPFVVEDGDNKYIFIEEEPLNSHGHISLITMQKDGSVSDAKPIIKKPYHLSYPFVFKHNNRYYMIPESSENRTIELYEAVNFPYKWEFKQNLMSDIHAVDTTLFYKDEKWWMFTSITEFKGAWDNGSFSLFFSDDLFSSSWSEHPQNPISTDPSNARMAGAVFEKDKKLYRPSQNCEKRYGYGFNICEILKLSDTEYEESIVTRVEPLKNGAVLGVHTINYADDFTIIDAVQMRSKFI